MAIIRNVTQTTLHLASLCDKLECSSERRLKRRYHPTIPEHFLTDGQSFHKTEKKSLQQYVEERRMMYQHFGIPPATEFTSPFVYDGLHLQPLSNSQRMAARAFNLALSLPKSDRRRNILFIGEYTSICNRELLGMWGKCS